MRILIIAIRSHRYRIHDIGSTRLNSDLLHLLHQDSVLNLCLEKVRLHVELEASQYSVAPCTHILQLPPQSKSVIESLKKILDYLLQSEQEEEELPLYAALLLSHAHLSREVCVERLKGFLHSSNPSHQSMVRHACEASPTVQY